MSRFLIVKTAVLPGCYAATRIIIDLLVAPSHLNVRRPGPVCLPAAAADAIGLLRRVRKLLAARLDALSVAHLRRKHIRSWNV
jgi:hypothetical protein